jgi:hypothetical protein
MTGMVVNLENVNKISYFKVLQLTLTFLTMLAITAVMMKAANASETCTTRRNVPEDSHVPFCIVCLSSVVMKPLDSLLVNISFHQL